MYFSEVEHSIVAVKLIASALLCTFVGIRDRRRMRR